MLKGKSNPGPPEEPPEVAVGAGGPSPGSTLPQIVECREKSGFPKNGAAPSAMAVVASNAYFDGKAPDRLLFTCLTSYINVLHRAPKWRSMSPFSPNSLRECRLHRNYL
jgi:hypothetical protein